MSAVDVVQRLRAAADGRARPRTTMRHRHVGDGPLVVVAYQLAGEAAAPLGVMVGTDRDEPTLLVAPEPRSRQIRFEHVFNPFAEIVVAYVRAIAGDRIADGSGEVCRSAPNVVVPNNATAELVGPMFGRSLRYLATDGEYAVPLTTVEAGMHLTWIGSQREVPGSSVLLAATDLLRRHWVSGLSDLESEDLHVHLAWIDPPPGTTGRDAAAEVEAGRIAGSVPAAGPTPDPSWDRDVLDPRIAEFNRTRDGSLDPAVVTDLGEVVRDAVADALRPTWDATWRSVDLLHSLPMAPSVDARWRDDRWEFTRHADRVDTGEARFTARDSVKQAAYAVSRREAAQAALDATEALDDPLVMAAAIGDGQALSGLVIDVDRPFVVVELAAPCPVPLGTTLFWAAMPTKCSVVVEAAATDEPFTVTLRTQAGKTKYYPDLGDRVVYSPFKPSGIRGPKLPDEVPWTHAGPPSEAPGPEVPE